MSLKQAVEQMEDEIIELRKQVAEFQEVNRKQFADMLAAINERDALSKQVLELSAQVEVMRAAVEEAARNENYPPFAKSKFQAALSIEPSSALIAHDNEVAAKELEEAANWFEGERYFKMVDSQYELLTETKLRELAIERRNRK